VHHGHFSDSTSIAKALNDAFTQVPIFGGVGRCSPRYYLLP